MAASNLFFCRIESKRTDSHVLYLQFVQWGGGEMNLVAWIPPISFRIRNQLMILMKISN